jgi:hypothetical protein
MHKVAPSDRMILNCYVSVSQLKHSSALDSSALDSSALVKNKTKHHTAGDEFFVLVDECQICHSSLDTRRSTNKVNKYIHVLFLLRRRKTSHESQKYSKDAFYFIDHRSSLLSTRRHLLSARRDDKWRVCILYSNDSDHSGSNFNRFEKNLAITITDWNCKILLESINLSRYHSITNYMHFAFCNAGTFVVLFRFLLVCCKSVHINK